MWFNMLSDYSIRCEGVTDFFAKIIPWLSQLWYGIVTVLVKVTGYFADMMNVAFYVFSGVDLKVNENASSNSFDISINGEKKNILDYFIFSETMTNAYTWLAIVGLILIVIFTIYRIIKQDYFDKSGPRSKGPIFRNVAISCISFLLVIPIFYLIIHASSLLSVTVMDAMGMKASRFAGAKIFELTWSDNGAMVREINSKLNNPKGSAVVEPLQMMDQLNNQTLFTILADGQYVSASPNIVDALGIKWSGKLSGVNNSVTGVALGAPTFYWYLYFVAIIIAIKTLYKLLLAVLQRIFKLVGLFLVAPSPISQYVLDDGQKYKKWLAQSIHEGLRLVVAVMSFSLWLMVLGVVGEIDFVGAFGAASGVQSGTAEALNVTTGLLSDRAVEGVAFLTEASDVATKAGSEGAFNNMVNAFMRIFLLIGAGGAVADLDGVITPLISGEKGSLESGDTGKSAGGLVTGVAKPIATGIGAAVGGIAGLAAGGLGNRADKKAAKEEGKHKAEDEHKKSDKSKDGVSGPGSPEGGTPGKPGSGKGKEELSNSKGTEKPNSSGPKDAAEKVAAGKKNKPSKNSINKLNLKYTGNKLKNGVKNGFASLKDIGSATLGAGARATFNGWRSELLKSFGSVGEALDTGFKGGTEAGKKASKSINDRRLDRIKNDAYEKQMLEYRKRAAEAIEEKKDLVDKKVEKLNEANEVESKLFDESKEAGVEARKAQTLSDVAREEAFNAHVKNGASKEMAEVMSNKDGILNKLGIHHDMSYEEAAKKISKSKKAPQQVKDVFANKDAEKFYKTDVTKAAIEYGAEAAKAKKEEKEIKAELKAAIKNTDKCKADATGSVVQLSTATAHAESIGSDVSIGAEKTMLSAQEAISVERQNPDKKPTLKAASSAQINALNDIKAVSYETVAKRRAEIVNNNKDKIVKLWDAKDMLHLTKIDERGIRYDELQSAIPRHAPEGTSKGLQEAISKRKMAAINNNIKLEDKFKAQVNSIENRKMKSDITKALKNNDLDELATLFNRHIMVDRYGEDCANSANVKQAMTAFSDYKKKVDTDFESGIKGHTDADCRGKVADVINSYGMQKFGDYINHARFVKIGANGQSSHKLVQACYELRGFANYAENQPIINELMGFVDLKNQCAHKYDLADKGIETLTALDQQQKNQRVYNQAIYDSMKSRAKDINCINRAVDDNYAKPLDDTQKSIIKLALGRDVNEANAESRKKDVQATLKHLYYAHAEDYKDAAEGSYRKLETDQQIRDVFKISVSNNHPHNLKTKLTNEAQRYFTSEDFDANNPEQLTLSGINKVKEIDLRTVKSMLGAKDNDK